MDGGGFTGDMFVAVLGTAAVTYALTTVREGIKTASTRGETMAAMQRDIKTLFERVEGVEETQDDHAEEQTDLREAMLLMGSHLETAVKAINELAQRWDDIIGRKKSAREPLTLSRPRLSPAPRRRSSRASTKRKRRAAA